jgi:hypothetical protein
MLLVRKKLTESMQKAVHGAAKLMQILAAVIRRLDPRNDFILFLKNELENERREKEFYRNSLLKVMNHEEANQEPPSLEDFVPLKSKLLWSQQKANAQRKLKEMREKRLKEVDDTN